MPLAREDQLQRLDDRGARIRFGDDPGRAPVERAQHVPRPGRARDHHQGNLGTGLAHLADAVEAVHARHLEVEQDQVGAAVLAQQIQRPGQAAGGEHLDVGIDFLAPGIDPADETKALSVPFPAQEFSSTLGAHPVMAIDDDRSAFIEECRLRVYGKGAERDEHGTIDFADCVFIWLTAVHQ